MKINREKEALITQERLKELLEYNFETGEFVWIAKTSKYSSVKVGRVAGGVSKSHGYIVIRVDGYLCLAHRLVWRYVYGYFPEGEGKPFIDHIDGDKVNNRVENLREVSRFENNRNARIRSDNKSGTHGVFRYKKNIRSGTKTYAYWYWVATWCNKEGKCQQQEFPIHIHGEHLSEQLAINYREEQIRLLELEHGIIYSERHGTSSTKEKTNENHN